MFAGHAAAASPADTERIRQFDVDITLSKENIAQVQEKIVYDFGANYKHGMYRDIPVEYSDGANSYYMQFTYRGTKDQQGQTVPVQQSSESGNERLRLGNPNQTITGAHTYAISYELGPILYQKNGQLFLNYDVIGTGFTVPIDNAKITFRTADSTPLGSLTCFQGSQGSSQACAVEQATPGVATMSLTGLQTGQGVTLNAYLPGSYTTNVLQPGVGKSRNFDSGFALGAIGILIGSILLPMFAITFLMFKFLKSKFDDRKLRKSQTIVPQYEPPKNLSPAEVGYLNDDVSDGVEITATLIDLARRGHLTIAQNAAPTGVSKLLGGKPDYTFTAAEIPPADQRTPAEDKIFQAIFCQGKIAQLSTLNKNAMGKAVQSFDKMIAKSMREKGFYNRVGRLIPTDHLTSLGASEWARAEGFKLYITVAEKDRLAFTDAPSKTPERFSALLPYAIALGVEKEWAKQFAGINLGPATQWYAGDIAMLNLASMSQGFDIVLPSSSSSNSSFSSDGGFSGGGSGGGGGGSW